MNKKVICFDFDGVIASYDGWKGFDVLGHPNINVIKTIRKLKSEGYYVLIFTTRPFTPTMNAWLKAYDVPFDSVNTNGHNPPMTSMKPIFLVMIDDRAIRYVKQDHIDLYDEIMGALNIKD